MNPYDFVPVDWNKTPGRKCLSSHDRFDGISGKIEGSITAETPLFIFDSPKANQGPQPFIKNVQDEHVIPGSSLKGLFRNLVETIGNGCFVFDKLNYKYKNLNYQDKLPSDFRKCNAAGLCIACRMFGRIPGEGEDSNPHLGKVSFNDAEQAEIHKHAPIYTIALMSPKPHHQAFYLDGNRIAGRKFYFHQPGGIQTENRETGYNQCIKPIDSGSRFRFSVQLTNLEDIELKTLLYALVLEPDMRHKIGYGKPAGLGSVRFDVTKLTLTDYVRRYKDNQGTTEYGNKGDLACYLSKQTQSFTSDKTSPTLCALRRIWRWDPSDKTVYRYPARKWFDDNSATPIGNTP